MSGPEIRIGTSGWHYNHWYKLFYPDKMPSLEMLAFYSKHFDTVEINNTFYALPLEATFKRWKQTVPAVFRFAVKGSRYITHIKKLLDPEEPLKRFLPLAALLEEKLGTILFQFPRTWDLHLDRLRHFLSALPPWGRYAFEFRHPAWHSEAVYSLLERRRAAFCIYDFGGRSSPLKVTTDFVYVRLHAGSNHGSYTEAELEVWAERIKEWVGAGRSVDFYFNNDSQGFALNNAKLLKEKLGIGKTQSPVNGLKP